MGSLDPLLRKYGVNLMLAGHEHHYERTYPVHDGRRTTSHRGELYMPYGFLAAEGDGSSLPDTIRVVVGTGGRDIRERCGREVCCRRLGDSGASRVGQSCATRRLVLY